MPVRTLILVPLIIWTISVFGQRINGVTVVAPPEPVSDQAFVEVNKIKAGWVCLVPYGYHKKGETRTKFNIDWQWWGERKEGLIECIKKSQKEGLKIMLKPQVYIPYSWVGDLSFAKESQWREWEEGYREFIMFFAEIASEYDIEMFCIGTEYKIAIAKRESFWRELIKEIRSDYNGQLTYSSNWDNYEEVPFWDVLDIIGISAYFPLLPDKMPSLKDLESAWNPIVKRMEKFTKKHNKDVLFTEYGYLTIDGCAYRAWELEKIVHQTPINENAQANAFAALYNVFLKKDWWKGGFIWKWFPDGMGHEGYPAKDYTPQGKKSEKVIRAYYENM